MNCNKLSVIGLASASLLVVGCVGEDPSLREEGQEAIALNRIALNGIVANRVVATAIADNPLSVGTVGGELQANPVSNPLMSSAEGREYFAYIVSCAMPAGQVVQGTSSGVPYSFPGSVGLAPAWETRALTDSERRWVSACLLARVNAYGVSVTISMRGDHQALVPTMSEEEQFGLIEGSFYGDIFTADQSKMEMVACRGAGQAAGETGGLVDRDCTEPAANGLTVCGMRYAGDCLDYSPQTPSAHACEYSWGGHYQSCHTSAGNGTWPANSVRTEVITTFVANQ